MLRSGSVSFWEKKVCFPEKSSFVADNKVKVVNHTMQGLGERMLCGVSENCLSASVPPGRLFADPA